MTTKDEQRKFVIIGMGASVIRTRYLAMLYIHGLGLTESHYIFDRYNIVIQNMRRNKRNEHSAYTPSTFDAANFRRVAMSI